MDSEACEAPPPPLGDDVPEGPEGADVAEGACAPAAAAREPEPASFEPLSQSAVSRFARGIALRWYSPLEDERRVKFAALRARQIEARMKSLVTDGNSRKLLEVANAITS